MKTLELEYMQAMQQTDAAIEIWKDDEKNNEITYRFDTVAILTDYELITVDKTDNSEIIAIHELSKYIYSVLKKWAEID
jgi:hypothetical protein